MKRKIKMILFTFIALIVILIIATLIILPPSKGKVPEFKDENGNVIENSIAEKTWIDIDGSKLGLIIVGENKNNPVLLVCGGGPGIPEYLLESFYPSVLTKHFVVVYFDYRGTGLSYQKVDPDSIDTERYLKDVDVITDYLINRFDKEKIYLMGHSFGTYIGLNVSKTHPEKYEAYLAVSQIASTMESEYIAYDYMLEEYKKQKDSSMVSKLEKYPIRESNEIFDKYASSGVRDKAMHKLGVGTTRKMHSVISELFFPSLRIKAYTVNERINIWKGKKASNDFKVSDESHAFNAFNEVKSLEIPIYFFAGKYDYTCAESLQRKYYEFVDAPKKKYFLYENSAHSPIFEEYDKTDEYIKKILNK
jgi:pimeloyl-ACP methyl ester carboxylesterase